MNALSRSGMLVGVGAAAMYFLDPARGRRRRVTAGDALVHWQNLSRRYFRRFGRDLENRGSGSMAKARKIFRCETVSDDQLRDRVRSALGRVLSRPHEVKVKCSEGAVEITGQIFTHEVESLRHAVVSVSGVRDVSMAVQTARKPERSGGARGERVREAPVGLFGAGWSPTARTAVGGAGLALLLEGFRRGGTAGFVRGAAGALLLARSVANMPLRQVPFAGIHVEKTIHLRASRDEVFTFWTKPQNYATVFSHVRRVIPESDGVYRWELAGPPGMPLSWTGKITRQVTGERIEWQSVPGSAIGNRGVTCFEDAGKGYTRIHIQLEYWPPAGLLGHAFAKLVGLDPRSLMHHDFVQLQSLLERGATRAHGRKVSRTELGIAQPHSADEPLTGTA